MNQTPSEQSRLLVSLLVDRQAWSARYVVSERTCPYNLLVRTHGIAERVLTTLQNGLVSLEMSALVGDFLRLSSEELDLTIGHVVDHKWRKCVLREVVQQVALDDLVGDSGDEVSHLVLRSC